MDDMDDMDDGIERICEECEFTEFFVQDGQRVCSRCYVVVPVSHFLVAISFKITFIYFACFLFQGFITMFNDYEGPGVTGRRRTNYNKKNPIPKIVDERGMLNMNNIILNISV